MVGPTKVAFWYKESEFRLTNIELLTLALLLKDANSYPSPFLYDLDESKRLESRIASHFVTFGLKGIPGNLEIS